MTSDPRYELRAFLGTRFPGIRFADEDDIFKLGFVNSLFAMELVLFIERTFAFELADEELTLDNFRTVNAMAELVGKHKSGAGQTAVR
jgi:methoxymalonate biosynthesis acyl carrier protein